MTKAHERILSRNSQDAGVARTCPDPSVCQTCPGNRTCIYLQNQSKRRFLTELLTLVERRVSIGSDLLSVHTAARVLSERVQEGPAGVTKTTRVAKMIVETMDRIRATQWGQSITDYRAEKWHMGRPSRVIYSVDQGTVESLRWYLEHFDQSESSSRQDSGPTPVEAESTSENSPGETFSSNMETSAPSTLDVLIDVIEQKLRTLEELSHVNSKPPTSEVPQTVTGGESGA